MTPPAPTPEVSRTAPEVTDSGGLVKRTAAWGSRGGYGAAAEGVGCAGGAEAAAFTVLLSPPQSRHQKRARAQARLRNLEAYAAQPHSFVFTRGSAGRSVRQLSLDVRRVMEPLTATRLQIRKKNSLKDCVAVAGPLGVTHFLILSKTETSVYFKLMRLPGGPTLTFQINKYTLVRDVVSSLRRHRMHEQQFAHPPLLVLNNFGPHGMHVKLMATMFQNLFPSINVHKVNLNTIKRCLLINYNADSQELDFRHYSIKVVPVGASRGMKKLLQEKFPNMSRLQDISELLATGAGLSESEAEPDGEHNITELPQAVAGRGNMRAQQSAVRLTEIGPRMTLQLIKIQEGVGEGSVLFHSFVHKTEEELQAILAAKEEKLRLKAQRQNQQAQNVQRKQERREAHKKKSLAGMKRARADGDSDAEDPGAPPEAEGPAQQEEEEDEAEYFRQAVGEEPDEDMFPRVTKRRLHTGPPGKKQRVKERRPDQGRGQDGGQRPLKPKGRPRGPRVKPGYRGVARDQSRGKPKKRGA
ncbi:Suppressor of SWI4 1-like protein [Sciurus carolinensis]|uniref:Suppressor of SWI4 1-like protein n=1 Tax=Sciurus carolinensis TaxID=30640 RepID=A0AA41MC07_SCICA|nr:Suppressor of SWI4 1-like protein [Sciurus carolinensis]